MTKILNANQLRTVDAATVRLQGITSLDLMETAATRCMNWIEDQKYIEDETIFHIFCGVGNNGGDGLALARLLSLEFYDVQVYVVHFSDKMSDDFISNFNRAEEFQLHPQSIHSEDDFPEIGENDVIIDAIFGIGLKQAPKGFTKSLIQYLNNSKAIKFSIDVPSGLFIDRPVTDIESVIKATVVLTFQIPKLGMLLPENAVFVQHFEILDIGLDLETIEKQETSFHYLSRFEVFDFYMKREKYMHKGHFGHALIIGGSFGKMGSVVLATKASLKIGSGLSTAYIPKSGYQILQISVPEAMVEVDAEDSIEYFNFKTKPTAIGIGIGMGTDDKTAYGFYHFMQNNDVPTVFDADALNLIAMKKEMFSHFKPNQILTPHPKELERLIGAWKNDYEKMEKLRDFTIKYPVVLVVKGMHTMIVQNGEFYFNSTGNVALAKAGSGDVLTGVITGLLAQNYSPLHAAILGVYIHGLTANLFTTINIPDTFMASDIINYLSSAYNMLLSDFEKNNDDDEDDFMFEDPNFMDDDD